MLVTTYLDVTQAGHQWILLMRPRSMFPTDGSTNWCLAYAVLLDLLLLFFSWIRPPTLPPQNLYTLHRSTRAHHHTILQTPLTSKGLSILAELTSVVPRCFLRPDSLSSWRFVNNQLLCLLCQDRTYF
ncbi:hypothetical protein CHARACLAT_027376 [Characodon lateralis]|uniref:Uncharacterized protein n=1 Tax=Characodon lateralis TaxID=208331 RepID=A0ABU7F7H9_9TELE|nr:hypothetical protein [Characodon lateralis]